VTARDPISDDKYRALVDSIDEGFCICEMIVDASGGPADYRLLEINHLFEQQTGLQRPTGKTARELVPDLEQKWFDVYGEVALERRSVRFRQSSKAMGRDFDVYAFPFGRPEERQFAVLFRDVTTQRKSEERLRFLADMNLVLQQLDDPGDLMAATARLLGEHLEVNRCAYAEIFSDEDSFEVHGDYTSDTFTIIGQFRLSDFGEQAHRAMLDNIPWVVNDAASDPRISASKRVAYETTDIAAVIAVPLHKRGKLVAGMAVHNRTPRVWTQDEIEVVHLVVQRCWESVERIRSQRQLREQKERFRDLFEGAAHSIWEEDFTTVKAALEALRAEGIDDIRAYCAQHPEFVDEAIRAVRITSVNRSSLKMFAAKSQDELLRSLTAIFLPETRSVFIEELVAIFEGRTEFEGQTRLKTLEGETREILFALTFPAIDESFERVIVSLIDVTDLERSRAALRNSEERSRLAVEAAGFGIFEWRPDESSLLWENDRMFEIFGRTREDGPITVEDFSRVLHSDESSDFGDWQQRPLLPGEPFRATFRIRRESDGENGRRRVLGVVADITERVRIEVALRESEERFRQMADSAPVMSWVTDPLGTCTFLSRTWYDFTGQTPETGLGFGWLEAVHPDDRERSGTIFIESNARHVPFRVEYRLRDANGDYRWAIDSAAPRFGSNGEYLGYVGSVIDITDRKRAEDALRASAEALRDADRLKDEFLATLSHELRTPLTSILGWAQMIGTGRSSDEEMRAGVDAIARAARAQSALIEDVLDISRITSGKMRVDRRPFSIRNVIQSAVETVQPGADARNIELRCDLAGDLGSPMIDPDRMQQILWNLLSNAIKFTPQGGKVGIRANRGKNDIRIEVSDTGSGISPQFLPHLFQRFRQADSSSRRAYSGLGIGLALTKDLVTLHGGTIDVESEEGRGSRFIVTIPAEIAQQQTALTEDATRALQGERVLVVDDDLDTRRLFAVILRRSGAEVLTASSVEEALELTRHFRPDVILADIAMPDRDGHDLVRELRSESSKIPVIAVTANGVESAGTGDGGFARVVRKPVTADRLVAAVMQIKTAN
jgi:PAS domain S-box-containing protein